MSYNTCSGCGQQFSGIRALITNEERWCAGSTARLNAPTVFSTNREDYDPFDGNDRYSSSDDSEDNEFSFEYSKSWQYLRSERNNPTGNEEYPVMHPDYDSNEPITSYKGI